MRSQPDRHGHRLPFSVDGDACGRGFCGTGAERCRSRGDSGRQHVQAAENSGVVLRGYRGVQLPQLQISRSAGRCKSQFVLRLCRSVVLCDSLWPLCYAFRNLTHRTQRKTTENTEGSSAEKRNRRRKQEDRLLFTSSRRNVCAAHAFLVAAPPRYFLVNCLVLRDISVHPWSDLAKRNFSRENSCHATFRCTRWPA